MTLIELPAIVTSSMEFIASTAKRSPLPTLPFLQTSGAFRFLVSHYTGPTFRAGNYRGISRTGIDGGISRAGNHGGISRAGIDGGISRAGIHGGISRAGNSRTGFRSGSQRVPVRRWIDGSWHESEDLANGIGLITLRDSHKGQKF